MKLGYGAAAAGVLALTATLVAQGPGPRRDGNWEVTMEIEMPGMPQRMPAMTSTQCVSKEEAADPSKMMSQGSGGASALPPDCKVSDMKTAGNTTSWSMKCDGDNAMSGTGELTYAGDTYRGAMKMNIERGGQPMAVTMTYSGKRLGDCTK
jgi:hypothetical protein